MTSEKLGWSLWWSAGLLILATAATEMLPVIFGTGSQATWDWAFTYVSLKYIVLPIHCVVHFGVTGVLMIVYWRRPGRSHWWPVSSAVAPIGYLLGLSLRPLFWLSWAS